MNKNFRGNNTEYIYCSPVERSTWPLSLQQVSVAIVFIEVCSPPIYLPGTDESILKCGEISHSSSFSGTWVLPIEVLICFFEYPSVIWTFCDLCVYNLISVYRDLFMFVGYSYWWLMLWPVGILPVVIGSPLLLVCVLCLDVWRLISRSDTLLAIGACDVVQLLH
jgi:hypothetical protein